MKRAGILVAAAVALARASCAWAADGAAVEKAPTIAELSRAGIDFEDYIRWGIKEFKFEYRDFTVICDDDAKLDRLILTLELYARQSIPSELR